MRTVSENRKDRSQARSRVLHDGRPYRHAMTVSGNADAFANALIGVYATDPHYGRSLTALMKALDLYRYDCQAA
jgi:flagellum-specific peptidoglycan hydrolase FlgJ